MKNIFKLNVVAAIALLSGCQNTEDPTAAKSLADISNADLVRLCERADLQDVALDYFVESVFKRNAANARLLGSLYDQGLSEEKIRQETSIDNIRAERHSAEQVDCIVDFVPMCHRKKLDLVRLSLPMLNIRSFSSRIVPIKW